MRRSHNVNKLFLTETNLTVPKFHDTAMEILRYCLFLRSSSQITLELISQITRNEP